MWIRIFLACGILASNAHAWHTIFPCHPYRIQGSSKISHSDCVPATLRLSMEEDTAVVHAAGYMDTRKRSTTLDFSGQYGWWLNDDAHVGKVFVSHQNLKPIGAGHDGQNEERQVRHHPPSSKFKDPDSRIRLLTTKWDCKQAVGECGRSSQSTDSQTDSLNAQTCSEWCCQPGYLLHLRDTIDFQDSGQNDRDFSCQETRIRITCNKKTHRKDISNDTVLALLGFQNDQGHAGQASRYLASSLALRGLMAPVVLEDQQSCGARSALQTRSSTARAKTFRRNLTQLRAHRIIWIHDDDPLLKPQPIRCKYCQKIFKSDLALAQHQKDRYQGKICDTCDKAFKTAEEMQEHVLAKHGAWKCRTCGKRFMTEYGLSEHYKMMRHKKNA
jgi:hypothetical protein